MPGLHADGAQVLRIANAGDLQQARRIERPCRDDDFAAGAHLALGRARAAGAVAHSHGALAFQQHACGRAAGAQIDASSLQRWVQVGAGRTQAPGREAARVDHELPGAHAVLRLGVGVGHVGVAQALGCLDEQVAQRAGSDRVGHDQRPFAAPVAVVARAQARLALLEVGQHVLIAPAGVTHGGPVVEVVALATVVYQSIDGTRAADDFALRQFDGAPIRTGDGPAAKAPHQLVVEQVLDVARRNVDEGVGVARARLEYTHRVARLGQPRGHDAARTARADDHVVEGVAHGLRHPG